MQNLISLEIEKYRISWRERTRQSGSLTTTNKNSGTRNTFPPRPVDPAPAEHLLTYLLSSDLLRVARWSAVLRCGSSSLAVYFCGRRPRRRGPTNTRRAPRRCGCTFASGPPPPLLPVPSARATPWGPRAARSFASAHAAHASEGTGTRAAAAQQELHIAHQLQQQRAAKPTRRSPVGKTLVPPRTAISCRTGRLGAAPREPQQLPPQRAVPCTTHRSHKTSRDRPHLRRLRCTPHSRETCTPSGRERRPPWACAVRFAPAQHARTHPRLHIRPLASPRTTPISCAALYQLHHASLGAVFATQTPPHPGGNPAQSSSHGDHGAPLLRPLVGMPRGVRRGGLRGGTARVLVRSA